MWVGSPNWRYTILHFSKICTLFWISGSEHIWLAWPPGVFRVDSGQFSAWNNVERQNFRTFVFFSAVSYPSTPLADRWISMDIKDFNGFLRIWEDFEISWNLLVRSWRVYPARVARGRFFHRKRTFQKRLKRFELTFLCFSTLSDRFDVVDVTNDHGCHQNVENCWKSRILIDSGDFGDIRDR